MATAAPTQELPLFYSSLEALNSGQHGKYASAGGERSRMACACCAGHGGRVRASAAPLPDRLLGRWGSGSAGADGPERGRERFPGPDGHPHDPSIYIPAYMRRYPFLLARLRPDSDELSLCFDPTSGAVGEFDEGEAAVRWRPAFGATKAILQFCEQFETAGQRTAAFIQELKNERPADGRRSRNPARRAPQPFIYRGFRMVDEEKLREMRGDELRKMNQSGLLPLIYAHLFSLSQIREVFARQIQQGKGPVAARQPIPAEA